VRICDVPGCGRKHLALGLCANHYQAKRRAELGPPPVPGLWSGQVARILGVSLRTVQRMIEAGDLLAERSPGGNFRIDPASVEAHITTDAQLARYRLEVA